MPAHIRSDNGSELTAKRVRNWLKRLEVKLLFIEPGSPWENGYIEFFNGRIRDEVLNGEIFYALKEAQVLLRYGEHGTLLRISGRFLSETPQLQNYIMEARYDTAVNRLLLRSFWSNVVIFQLMMLTYNLFLLFKMDMVKVMEYRQQIKLFRLIYTFLAGRSSAQ